VRLLSYKDAYWCSSLSSKRGVWTALIILVSDLKAKGTGDSIYIYDLGMFSASIRPAKRHTRLQSEVGSEMERTLPISF
jgi:hypothetical protein